MAQQQWRKTAFGTTTGPWEDDPFSAAQRQAGNQNADLMLRMALANAQMGFQREELGARREDNALTRQAEADAQAKKYGYLSGRDTIADKQWGDEFGMKSADAAEQRRQSQQMFDFNKEDALLRRALQKEANDLQRPLTELEVARKKMELEREKKLQENMGNPMAAVPPGGAAPTPYSPKSQKAIDAYGNIVEQTGNVNQATRTARAVDRDEALQAAEAKARTVGSEIGAFSARDTKMLGGDPTQADKDRLTANIALVAALYKDAGMNDADIEAKIREMILKNAGNFKDMNAGWIQGVLREFGIDKNTPYYVAPQAAK